MRQPHFKILFYKGNLLVLDLIGYYSKLNEDSVFQVRKTLIINLITGKLHEIKDLFTDGSKWNVSINKIISQMIKEDPQYEFIFPHSFKGIDKNQDFYIDNKNLYIYYHPGEIAPKAAGFVAFTIPFKTIEKVMNKDGELYKLLNS
ncbi:hypothetical protein AAT22_11195 [Clostridium sp. C8]|nr:hypothetical protein AAT22_11195 [Clostridium sp. C8]